MFINKVVQKLYPNDNRCSWGDLLNGIHLYDFGFYSFLEWTEVLLENRKNAFVFQNKNANKNHHIFTRSRMKLLVKLEKGIPPEQQQNQQNIN